MKKRVGCAQRTTMNQEQTQLEFTAPGARSAPCGFPFKRYFLIFGLLVFFCTFAFAQDEGVVEEILEDESEIAEVSKVEVTYVGTVPLEDLVRGALGRGDLIYYLPERGIEKPSLVVQLNNGSAQITAKVHDAPEGLDYVPISIQEDRIEFTQPNPAVITLTTEDGTWLHDGNPNYNLEVMISGPIIASWLADRFASRIAKGENLITILVRDREKDGVPDWDLRRVLPPFEGSGFLRVNYAERTCKTPTNIDKGVSPLWPYVALGGSEGFEQPYNSNRLVPPIRVDWRRGRVTAFGETVTVRNQKCGYAFYSISPIELGELNSTNFESPFAFYDFSDQETNFPNLLLRTDHFPAQDRWSIGLGGAALAGVPLAVDFSRVRYSWRNDVGDGFWDYKIEVLGFHPYTSETPIGDGIAYIDTPAYADMPSWVVEKNWPVTTFMDAEGNGYRSSEGIYEWAPDELGITYLIGTTETPNLEVFENIRAGFRGEYRYRQDLQPHLYFSSVDNRFHLLGADGGRWDLGGGSYITVENLSRGLYIDRWTLYDSSGEAREDLYDLGDYLLYTDGETLRFKKTSESRVLLTAIPPYDKASWQEFVNLSEQYDPLRRDGLEMSGWLEAFQGSTLNLQGMTLSNLQVEGDTFRFVLEVSESASSSGDLTLPEVQGLAPGTYMVTYDKTTQVWQSKAATTPKVTSTLTTSNLSEYTPGLLTITLTNESTLDWSGAVSLQVDGLELEVWETLNVPGERELKVTSEWIPEYADTSEAILTVDGVAKSYSLEVAPSMRVSGVDAVAMSTPARTPLIALLFAALVLGGGVGFWYLRRLL